METTAPAMAEQYEKRFAAAEAALRDGQPVEAEVLGRRLMADFDSPPRAVCVMAKALIDQDRAPDALRLMWPLNDRVETAEVRFVTASALMADGQMELAQELLRQSLDLDPDLLPASLMLVRNLAASGFEKLALRELRNAQGLNPGHSESSALLHRLVIETVDRESIIMLVEHRFREVEALNPKDVGIAAAMLLDDRGFVRQLRVTPSSGALPRLDDPWSQLVGAWLVAEPRQRFEVAAVIVARMLEIVDDDPLRWPDPPISGRMRHSPKGSGSAPDGVGLTISLVRSWLAPSPLNQSARLVEAALRRWPGHGTLIRLSAILALWVGDSGKAQQRLDQLTTDTVTTAAIRALIKGDEDAALHFAASAQEPNPTLQWIDLSGALRRRDAGAAKMALRALLTSGPFREPAILLAARSELNQDQAVRGPWWIKLAREVAPWTADLVECRLRLAQGAPADALDIAERLSRDDTVPIPLRGCAAALEVQAHLALRQPRLAMSSLEMATGLLPIHVAARDVLRMCVMIESGEQDRALDAMAVLLNDTRTPPRWRDRALACGLATMKPHFLWGHIEWLLRSRSIDPLYLLYGAECLKRLHCDDQALNLARRAWELRPGAPRAIKAVAALTVVEETLESTWPGGLQMADHLTPWRRSEQGPPDSRYPQVDATDH